MNANKNFDRWKERVFVWFAQPHNKQNTVCCCCCCDCQIWFRVDLRVVWAFEKKKKLTKYPPTYDLSKVFCLFFGRRLFFFFDRWKSVRKKIFCFVFFGVCLLCFVDCFCFPPPLLPHPSPLLTVIFFSLLRIFVSFSTFFFSQLVLLFLLLIFVPRDKFKFSVYIYSNKVAINF